MTTDPKRIARAVVALPRPLLVALDVDGTLAPIVEEPDAARVPPKTRAIVRRLTRLPRVRVALITGRSAASLKKVAGVTGVWRALEHGRVIVPPGAPTPRGEVDPIARERLDAFERWAREHVVPHGARLERKAAARAVHVRRLSESDPDEAARLLRAAQRYAEKLGLHARPGRAVVEAEAAPGDKGDALEAIRFASRTRGVVYAGDDVTDYPAIRRAADLGGIGIFVRSEERSRLPRGTLGAVVDGPEGMAELLAELVEALDARR